MSNIERFMSAEQRDLIAKLYKDLGWTEAARQHGMNRRICGRDIPLTNKQGNKVVQALQAMLMARVMPHYSAITALVQRLYDHAADLSSWERQFVRDVQRKVQRKVILSPRIIKKVREVAHHHDVECGFPGFRELAQMADDQRRSQRA